MNDVIAPCADPTTRPDPLEILSASIAPDRLEPGPLDLDPRPCEFCGLTIDRHDMVDHGEGPEFYCADVRPTT
jgi:hypothetical protein